MKARGRKARDLMLATMVLAIPLLVMAKQETPQPEPVAIRWEDPETVSVPHYGEMLITLRETPDVQATLTLEHESLENDYTLHDLEYLALVIYQEAGADACSDEMRQMVGEVVLNRVASDYYPDSIREVLLQPWQYGRLAFDGLVWPERAHTAAEAHAVDRAYEMAEALLSGAVERLLPEDAIYQAEFPQGSETLEYVGGMYFCR